MKGYFLKNIERKFRKIKAQNEAKRNDARERNFNFEFRSWATAPHEFGAFDFAFKFMLNFQCFLKK